MSAILESSDVFDPSSSSSSSWHSVNWTNVVAAVPSNNISLFVREKEAEEVQAIINKFNLHELAHGFYHNSNDNLTGHENLTALFNSNLSSSSAETSSDNTESAYSVIAREFRLFFYAIIFVICVFGNALVVITLAQNRRMRTVTNIFLINLAASDLLLGVFCMPFTLVGAMLREWIFGEVMCRAIPYFQCSTVVTSAVTLVSISLERYFAICRQLQSRRWQTKSHAYMMCVFCWLFGLVCALPVPILSQLIPMALPEQAQYDDETISSYTGPYKCREVYPQPQWIYEFLYQLFLACFVLILPLILMVAFYTLITLELYRGIGAAPSGSSSQKIPASSSAHEKISLAAEISTKQTHAAAADSPVESDVSSPIRAIRCSSRQSLQQQQQKSSTTTPPTLPSPVAGAHAFTEANGSNNHANSRCDSFGRKYYNTKRAVTTNLSQHPSVESFATIQGADHKKVVSHVIGGETDTMSDGLRSTHTERNLATKKKVIVMLIAVVVEFFICFTPITIFNLVAIAAPMTAYQVPSWGISFIQLLMYISTCCNPITYCFLNKKFRQGFKYAFTCGKARRLRLQQNQSLMMQANSRGNITTRGRLNSANASTKQQTSMTSAATNGSIARKNNKLVASAEYAEFDKDG